MGDVLTSTTQLTQEMQIHYDSVFLETADLVRKYNILATKKTIPKNGGVYVQFVRTTHFPVITAALTEGKMKVCALYKSFLNIVETLRDLTYMGGQLIIVV